MIQIISLVADNKPGVLARITSLLTARGCNIESLSAAHTEIATKSRLTVVVRLHPKQQSHKQKSHVIHQLNKIVDVIETVNLSEEPGIHRELALVRVSVTDNERGSFEADVKKFGGRILESTRHGNFIEISADLDTVEAFIKRLTRYGKLEVSRSGAVSLPRHSEPKHQIHHHEGGKNSWQQSDTTKPMEISVR